MQQLSIGEVARRTGITVETLRYYEYLGLLPPVARTRGGSRRYAAEIIAQLRFIKHAQSLGLSLRDIQTMTGRKGTDRRESCRQVHEILARQLDFVNQRLTELTEARQTLIAYLAACDRALHEAEAPECPVLAPVDCCGTPDDAAFVS
jgi:MerR family transcriptional regulator, mercuric resistance operon regulatory protein